jgi:adenylate kinase family enzyme
VISLFFKGYILDGFPVMDENLMKLRDQMEAMKNWPLPPDYVINIRIPDNDLINRRQGEKIDPMTGLLYIKEQYAPVPIEKVVSFVLLTRIMRNQLMNLDW